MKTRIKHKEDCTKIFQVEIPENVVKNITEEVYKEIKKIAKIPGFRIGFAPQDLLEKHYSKDAREEVLKRLIPEGYRKAIENHKVQPVSLPEVYNIRFEMDKALTFEAEVDVRPAIKLKIYKGQKVKKKSTDVTKPEINESFERLRNAYAKFKDVTRAIEKGDYAICDVEAFVDGKPISKKNPNMWIQAEKDASLLGMGEELVGLAKGQTKEIDTKLPETYPDKKFAGKLARFKVLVNEIKEKELPELNDEFAKTLNAENLDKLTEEIKVQLGKRKDNAAKIDMENQLIDKLLKDYRFSVPAKMVKRQKEVLGKRLEYELMRQGIHKDEVNKKVKELDPKLAEDAKNKVMLYFILDEISVKENIGVSKEDVTNKLKIVATQTGQTESEVRKHYEEKELLGGLAEEIKEEKVLEFLLKHADIS